MRARGKACGWRRGTMPSRPLRPCATTGCPELVEKGRCPTHTAEQERGRRQSETWRHAKGTNGKTIDVYQTPRWKALRLRVLREANYLCQCEECEKRPVGEPANTVDHRIPHHGRPELMWDRRNLRAMSASHHSRKTAGETVNG
jgi:5-methylcytosine-specific restriction enzyme A